MELSVDVILEIRWKYHETVKTIWKWMVFIGDIAVRKRNLISYQWCWNPIPIGEGQIIPTYYYWPLQIFSPSGITDIFLTLVKKLPSYILLTCTNRCIKLKQCACFFWPDVSRQIYHLWVPNSTYVIHSSSREGVDIKVCLQFYVKSCTIFSCEEKESPTKLQLSWLLQRSTKY